MKAEKFRDYAIGIAAIIFAISNLYGFYQQYQYSGTGCSASLSELNAYATCERFSDYYLATVNIQNFGSKEFKNIQCTITDKGELTSDTNQQNISDLAPQSTDACSFILKGNFTKPVKFEINYDGKSMKTICQLIQTPQI